MNIAIRISPVLLYNFIRQYFKVSVIVVGIYIPVKSGSRVERMVVTVSSCSSFDCSSVNSNSTTLNSGFYIGLIKQTVDHSEAFAAS